jgi:hypothetical protein
MKKLNYLLAMMTIAAALVSCDKRDTDVFADVSLKSLPVTDQGIEAIFFEGNPICGTGELDFYFEDNYNQQVTLPGGQILTISTSDDKILSWSLTPGKYCAGTFIVKGGNNAFIYEYEGGGYLSDSGLQSPPNNGGKTPTISHLCFSFVECQAEPIVLAIKAFFTAGPNYSVFPGVYSYATSDGIYIFNPAGPDFDETPGWCDDLGINYYPTTSTFSILGALTESYPGIREIVGTVVVSEEGGNLKVQVSLKPTGGILGNTFLYVGDLAGIYGTGACPVYTSVPWVMATPDPSDLKTVTFTVPYSN